MSGPTGDGLTGDRLRSLLLGYAGAGRVVADPVGTLALAPGEPALVRRVGAAARRPAARAARGAVARTPAAHPFAGVLSEKERQRVREAQRQLDDAHDVALIRARIATDSGRHVDLDEVITALGYDWAELEAELNAEHDADAEHPGVIPPGRPMPAPGRSSTPPFDDWSF